MTSPARAAPQRYAPASMNEAELSQLTRILQLSITPVALISGVALLLLTMTNRLGRVIDRARDLAGQVAAPGGDAESAPRQELRILFRRARLLQYAIAAISMSIFMAVLMVVALFAMYLLSAHLQGAVLTLFGGCLAGLVVATGCFLGDIVLSIRWLHVSLGKLV